MDAHDDQTMAMHSDEVFDPDESGTSDGLWKVIQNEDGFCIVTHVGTTRRVIIIFSVVFHTFAVFLMLWFEGRDIVVFLLLFLFIGISISALLVLGLTWYGRLGNLVEPAGRHKLRFPRKNVVISYEQIGGILLAKGLHIGAESRCQVTQVLIKLRNAKPGSQPMPIVTFMYRGYAEEVAQALAFETGAPIIRCE